EAPPLGLVLLSDQTKNRTIPSGRMAVEVAVSGFQHQVGGHFGLLQCEGHVAKPLDARELAFYKQMTPRFRKFAPVYCGTVQVKATAYKNGRLKLWSEKRGANPCHPGPPSGSRHEKVSSRTRLHQEETEEDPLQDMAAVMFRVNGEGRVEVETRDDTHHWAPSCQIKVVQRLLLAGCTGSNFILLENVVHGMRRPCVLDLKMGTRQHGDDAPLAKQDAQRRKCAESTSAALGVRMVGMELYEESTSSYQFVDKMQGRRMDERHLRACLMRFVRGAGRTRTAALRARLADLRSTLQEAHSYRFFSSSLLIAFDAAKPDSPIQVRMIDFAHSTFDEFEGFSDVAYQGADEGYIKGVDSLLDLIPMTEDERIFEAAITRDALVITDLMRPLPSDSSPVASSREASPTPPAVPPATAAL
ncbi:hypothetical protein PENTCL1PPCAC_6086, partial [Pristionchus entomophagus]